MKLGEFIYMADTIEAMEIAWKTNTNLMLVGPKGHGKSEVIEAFLASKGYFYGDEKTFVKTLHGGLDEANLYGGLNFKALNDPKDPRLDYNFSRSWLNYERVVFEEAFDAPLTTLASLKDTITSGFYRNGEEIIPVNTKTIFAATNRDIAEISSMGATYDALLDRFPIIKVVRWEKYEQEDYLLMLRTAAAKYVNANTEIVARLAARATQQGFMVSPRTCWLANKFVHEVKSVTPLKHIQGFAEVYSELAEMEREKSITEAFSVVKKNYDKTSDLPEYTLETIARKIKAYNEQIGTLSNAYVINALVQERDYFLAHAQEQISRLQQKLLELAASL